MPEVDLIVVDEAHACAGTQAYVDLFGQAKVPVIGLSATPYSKGLGKHYDSLGGPLFETIVTAARIEDLIRDGYLVGADIWAPSEPDLSNVKVTAGEYNEKDLGEAVDKVKLVGDIVENWHKFADGTPTVVFATNISHSKHIVEQFQASGVSAAHIDCYTSDEDRQEILHQVAAGDITVISNVGILAEGWDFPACKTLVLARPTKSLIRYLQMAGRVLRPYEGKGKAIILDHSGAVRRLGFPWDYFGQHLDDGKPKKSSAEKDKDEEALPKPCPHCSFMKPPRTVICPSCGFEARRPHQVEVEAGELVPMTKQARGVKGLEEVGRTAVYQQLLWIAHERGYKESWAACKYKDAYGCWPNGIPKMPAMPEGVVLGWVRSEQIRWAKGRQKARGAA
jgi:superfamily II DNA or RNA helicase